MGRRLRRVTGEAAKFSAVNALATVVAIGLFNLDVHVLHGPLAGSPVAAWFAANCVGMVISYWGSRRYAFRHRETRGPAGGAVTYVVVNLLSFLIPMGCLALTRYGFGLTSALADNLAANVVGSLLGMGARFWAFRRFVFTRRSVSYTGRRGTRVYGWPEPGVALDALERSGADPEVGPDEAELVEHQP